MDFSIFLTAEAWISLLTLIFLEVVLGFDNLVFITITSSRLPKNKQHIGRRLGLAGALLMRILFLCFASYLVHMVNPLFDVNLGFYAHSFSIRDLVMGIGGIYLLYKGVSELFRVLNLTELKAEATGDEKALGRIGLPKAVATIMIMDIVFSIDSVITAVGLANHLTIMILAVIIAIIFMMAFIDFISEFIENNPEMTILALFFIAGIGILLILEGLGIESGIEVLEMNMEKLMVYFAMIFSFFLFLVQMVYKRNLNKFYAENPQVADEREAEEAEEAEEA